MKELFISQACLAAVRAITTEGGLATSHMGRIEERRWRGAFRRCAARGPVHHPRRPMRTSWPSLDFLPDSSGGAGRAAHPPVLPRGPGLDYHLSRCASPAADTWRSSGARRGLLIATAGRGHLLGDLAGRARACVFPAVVMTPRRDVSSAPLTARRPPRSDGDATGAPGSAPGT